MALQGLLAGAGDRCTCRHLTQAVARGPLTRSPDEGEREVEHTLQVPGAPDHCPGEAPEAMDKKLPIAERRAQGWRGIPREPDSPPKMLSSQVPDW